MKLSDVSRVTEDHSSLWTDHVTGWSSYRRTATIQLSQPFMFDVNCQVNLNSTAKVPPLMVVTGAMADTYHGGRICAIGYKILKNGLGNMRQESTWVPPHEIDRLPELVQELVKLHTPWILGKS